jgi:hypothetical protein
LSVMGSRKAGRKCNGMKFDPTFYVYNILLYGNNIADSPAKPGQKLKLNWSVWNSILLLCTCGLVVLILFVALMLKKIKVLS